MVQAVSQSFIDAALNSPTMLPVVQASLTLVDNVTIGASITPTATSTEDATLVPVSKVINGVTVPDRQWAFSDAGSRCFPSNTLFPLDVGYEGGWWSGAISDGAGNITTQTVTLTYATAVNPTQVFWYGDSYLGYPVNFTVDYTTNGTTWVNIATVVGWAATSWQINAVLTGVVGLRINITVINYPNSRAVLLEFGAGQIVNITSQIKQFESLQERYPDTATVAVGNVSAGSNTLTLSNENNQWGPHNTASPYAGLLRQNRRISYRVGYVMKDGTTQMIPFYTYYTMNWSGTGGEPEATVRGQDRMKRLRDFNYTTCPVNQNMSVDALIAAACQAAGFGVNEYITYPSSVIIPYAWGNPTETFLKYISDLAAAAGGAVFINASNQLVFQDANYLHSSGLTSVLTITDNNARISSIDEFDEGWIRNIISCQVTPYSPASSGGIWSLPASFIIPASTTMTVNVTYQPSISVSAGTLTATGGGVVTTVSFTPYAASAAWVIQNSSGSAQTVSVMTVNGQQLTPASGQLIVAQNAAFVAQDGPKTMPISNRFIQTVSAANLVTGYLLTLYQSPPARIKIECIGLPWIELGDRVTVNSVQHGINADFWIVRHDFQYDQGYRSVFDAIAVV